MPQIVNNYELDAYQHIPYVWVLDSDFNKIDIIDDYTSLIWTRRYWETGDFELYMTANDRGLELLKLGNYVTRNDYPDEVYRIEKVEITTDAEEGNWITASGRDLRCIIYQRCTQFTWTYYSTTVAQDLETLIRQTVYENFINTTSWDDTEVDTSDEEGNSTGTTTVSNSKSQFNNPDRRIDILQLGNVGNIGVSLNSISIDRVNIGEWIEEMAEAYSFGWRVRFDKPDRNSSATLYFELYKGDDLSNEVVFAEKFENLRDTTYTYDRTDYYNCGQIVDSENNVTVNIGSAVGMDRYENVADTADDGLTSGTDDPLTCTNLIELFGWEWDGGSLNFEYASDNVTGSPIGSTVRNIRTYRMWLDSYDFPLYGDEYFEEMIKEAYPNGTEVTVSGVRYWRVTDTKMFLTPVYVNQQESNWNGWNQDTIESTEIYDGVTVTTCRIALYGTWNEVKDAQYVDPVKPGYNEETNTWDYSTTSNHQKYWGETQWELPYYIKQSMIQDNAYGLMSIWMKDEEFEGNLETTSLYRYRETYDIGDTVRIVTETGTDDDVSITEAVETFDSDGYTIEVGFEKG